MAQSKYILQVTVKSRCTNCNRAVTMLCHKDMLTRTPIFYICFECELVFQAGKGQVKREPLDATKEKSDD